MQLYETVLRPSVCLSVRPSHPAATRRCCGFAAVGPASRRYRPIAARPAGRRRRRPAAGAAQWRGGQMRLVPRCQLTYEAEQRLISVCG